MDSVWLNRGLFALLVLVVVGGLWLMLMPDREMEPQMQSGMKQPTPQSQDQAPQQPSQTPSEPQTAPEPDPEPQTPMYEMGIWEGKVAVYLPGTDVPMRITEMPVTSLPKADQKALKERIPVYDAEALASYLEDYGS